MKRIINSFFIILVLLLLCTPAFAQDIPAVTARGHIQNVGWQDVNSDENHHLIIGSVGQGLNLEAFSLQTSDPNLGIRYQSHVNNVGWQNSTDNGQISGTQGQNRKIEAVCIQLIGDNAPNYNLYYRAHVQNYGWLDWTTNFGAAGTTAHNFGLEALEVVLYPKDTPAPGPTTTPAVQATTRSEATHMYLINRLRKQTDPSLCYLTGDHNLKAVADLRVKEISQKFSHIRPNGQSFETAVKSVFPNYNQRGGEIKENLNIARTPRMTEPGYSFNYMTSYVQQMDQLLDRSARYMSWSAYTTGRLGYTVDLFSGLDRIDFAD